MNTTELESQVLSLAERLSPLHRLIKTKVLEPQKEPNVIYTREGHSKESEAEMPPSTIYTYSQKQMALKTEDFTPDDTEFRKQAMQNNLINQSAQCIVDHEIDEFLNFATKSFAGPEEIETIQSSVSKDRLAWVWNTLVSDGAHNGLMTTIRFGQPIFPLMLSMEARLNLFNAKSLVEINVSDLTGGMADEITSAVKGPDGKVAVSSGFLLLIYNKMPRWDWVGGDWVRRPFYSFSNKNGLAVINNDYVTAEFEDAFILSHRGMENRLPEGTQLVSIKDYGTHLTTLLTAMMVPLVPQYIHVLRFRRCAKTPQTP